MCLKASYFILVELRPAGAARAMGVLLCLLLGLLATSAQAAQPSKGVFETCPACRLSAMPELKRFLTDVVMKKHYENLEVKFIVGKTPTLILYDDKGAELSATEVDPKLNFDAIHTWIQSLGFRKTAAAAAGTEAGASSTAATSGAAAAAAGTPVTEALLPNVGEGPPPAPTPATAAGTPAAATAGSTPAATPAAVTTAAVTAAAGAAGPTSSIGPHPVATAADASSGAAAAAAAAGGGGGADSSSGPAPVPAQPGVQQQQRRRRRHRRRMRQRPGAKPGQAGLRRRRPKPQSGPGDLYH